MTALWWPTHVGAGEVVYPPGGTFGPRVQHGYQLVLLHTGSLSLTIDDKTCDYEAGVTLLLTPGHNEFFRFAIDSLTHHSWITVYAPPLPVAWLSASDQLPRAIPLSPHMNSLTKEAIHWTRCKNAQQLLLSIGHHAISLFLQEAKEAISLSAGLHEAAHLAERIIHTRFREDLCLSDISKLAAVSTEHLCRVFRQQYGTSPMAYLWRYRTQRAMDLLGATGLSVADIAALCGFKNQFHLHRRVKALTGLSPTQYRRKSQADAYS